MSLCLSPAVISHQKTAGHPYAGGLFRSQKQRMILLNHPRIHLFQGDQVLSLIVSGFFLTGSDSFSAFFMPSGIFQPLSRLDCILWLVLCLSFFQSFSNDLSAFFRMSESERLIQGWKLRLCSDFPFPFEFLYTLSILPSCLTRPAPFRSLSEAADLSASLHPQYNRQILQKQTSGQPGPSSGKAGSCPDLLSLIAPLSSYPPRHPSAAQPVASCQSAVPDSRQRWRDSCWAGPGL